MGRRPRAIAVGLFPTRVAVNLWGGNIPGAIARAQGRPWDKDHRLQGVAPLEVTQHWFARRTPVCGFHRIEYRAPRCSTRHPPNAIDAVQIGLGSDLVAGKQGGGLEGAQGQGGHEGITQRDRGTAFAVLGPVTKNVLHRAS